MATQKMIAFAPESIDKIYKYLLSKPAGEVLPLLREVEGGISFDAEVKEPVAAPAESPVSDATVVGEEPVKKRGRSAKLVP